MNPQQQEFEKALANLTPDERVNFTRSNPSVVVGDSRMNVTQSGVYEPIPKTINVGDIKTNEQLIPVPTVKPTTNIVSPYIAQPQNTTLQNGLATPVITPPAQQPEKSTYQKALEAIGVDIAKLDTKADVTKQLQEEQKLAEKTQKATEAYNAYTQKKLQYEQNIEKMRTAEANVVGGVGGGYTATIQDYQRKANADLANLAVEAQMSQGLVDSARQTIKDSIEAQFQPIQDRIDIRTKYAQLASNDLTESEKYQLQQLSQRETKEKDDLTKTFNDLASAVLDNGNPPGVLSSMNKVVDDYLNKRITGDEARAKLFSTAGKYGGDMKGGGATAPTVKSINGVDMQWNPATSSWEAINVASGTSKESVAKAQNIATQESTVQQIDNLIGSEFASSAVGPSALSRSQPGFISQSGRLVSVVGIPSAIGGAYQRLTGKQQNFIAGVEQLRSGLNLETLINAKSRGATFGALSDNELKVLANAGTKLGSWAIKNDDGNVVGYNVNEKDFKRELDKINAFTKLDYILNGGNPESVGVQVLSDGTYWTTNSDGSKTQIK